MLRVRACCGRHAPAERPQAELAEFKSGSGATAAAALSENAKLKARIAELDDEVQLLQAAAGTEAAGAPVKSDGGPPSGAPPPIVLVDQIKALRTELDEQAAAHKATKKQLARANAKRKEAAAELKRAKEQIEALQREVEATRANAEAEMAAERARLARLKQRTEVGALTKVQQADTMRAEELQREREEAERRRQELEADANAKLLAKEAEVGASITAAKEEAARIAVEAAERAAAEERERVRRTMRAALQKMMTAKVMAGWNTWQSFVRNDRAAEMSRARLRGFMRNMMIRWHRGRLFQSWQQWRRVVVVGVQEKLRDLEERAIEAELAMDAARRAAHEANARAREAARVAQEASKVHPNLSQLHQRHQHELSSAMKAVTAAKAEAQKNFEAFQRSERACARLAKTSRAHVAERNAALREAAETAQLLDLTRSRVREEFVKLRLQLDDKSRREQALRKALEAAREAAQTASAESGRLRDLSAHWRKEAETRGAIPVERAWVEDFAARAAGTLDSDAPEPEPRGRGRGRSARRGGGRSNSGSRSRSGGSRPRRQRERRHHDHPERYGAGEPTSESVSGDDGTEHARHHHRSRRHRSGGKGTGELAREGRSAHRRARSRPRSRSRSGSGSRSGSRSRPLAGQPAAFADEPPVDDEVSRAVAAALARGGDAAEEYGEPGDSHPRVRALGAQVDDFFSDIEERREPGTRGRGGGGAATRLSSQADDFLPSAPLSSQVDGFFSSS